MTAATERIPILVTKSDKARFARKAKTHGLSLSEFARAAMDRFDPSTDAEADALDQVLKQLRIGTAEAERSLDAALQYCAESEARLAKLDAWMRQQGYRP
ncbi:MAG: hypothetical protein EHM59_06165 [Betaproteobacteria bacterium]|nr:MAG: hypothetical protein EHM59_06165 [Betaproteobacteria bacterium]